MDHAIIRNCTDAIAELDEALQLPPGISDDEFFEKYCPPLPDNYDIQNDEPELHQFLLNERPFKRDAREQWGEREWRLHRWAYHRLMSASTSKLTWCSMLVVSRAMG